MELRALPHTPVGPRGAWRLHVGTAATTVRVLPLLGDIDPGGRGSARLELAQRLPLRADDRTEPHDRLRGLVDAHAGVRSQVELRAIVGCPLVLAGPLVGRAVRDGILRTYGGRFVHPRHERAYLEARARRSEAFVSLLSAAPWDPPDPLRAATEVEIPSFEVQSLLDDGQVVALGTVLFASWAVIAAAEHLRDGPGHRGRPFTASEAKRAWATSRRAAVPLLEHLRATGVTTFDGTHHRVIS